MRAVTRTKVFSSVRGLPKINHRPLESPFTLFFAKPLLKQIIELVSNLVIVYRVFNLLQVICITSPGRNKRGNNHNDT